MTGGRFAQPAQESSDRNETTGPRNATSMQPDDPFESFLGDLSALGVRPMTSGSNEFSLVAARSNPRWWLIPLDYGAGCAQAGLDMFQPVTRAANFAKTALRLQTHFGMPFTRRRIRLSGTPAFFFAFSQPGLCCAYFTGTDGPHRKTTAQIMTKRGDILGYAKVSRNPLVKPFLQNEARFLAQIAGLELKSTIVPKLIEHHDQRNLTQLVTDSLRESGHVVAHRLGAAHYAFLSELAQKTMHFGGAATLSNLERTIEALRPALSKGWIDRLTAGTARVAPMIDALPFALAHGDFTPWNTFIMGERLYVFDWEYAHSAYPLGFDLVHFLVSTNLSSPISTLLDQVETAVSATFYSGDRANSAQATLLSLLLHAAFFLNRSIEARGTEQDWGEVNRRACLIDALLERVDKN